MFRKCEINTVVRLLPIDILWALIKDYVANRNKYFKSDVKVLLSKAVNSVSVKRNLVNVKNKFIANEVPCCSTIHVTRDSEEREDKKENGVI